MLNEEDADLKRVAAECLIDISKSRPELLKQEVIDSIANILREPEADHDIKVRYNLENNKYLYVTLSFAVTNVLYFFFDNNI